MAEVFGIVSGAVSAAALIVQATSTLAGGSSRYTRYKELIERHHNSLYHVERHLKIWRQKWALGSLMSQDLYDRWGKPGWNEILRQLQLIHEDISRIYRRLYGQEELCTSDATIWQQLVERPDRPIAAGNAANSGFFHRLAYAIYKDEDLNGRLSSLGRRVETLDQLSDDNWIRTQGLSIGKTIDADEIEQGLRLDRNARECSQALDITYQYLTDRCENSWALLLPVPDEPPFCPLLDPTLVMFELISAATFAQNEIFQKVSLCCSYDNKRFQRDIQTSLNSQSGAGMGILQHNMRSFFQMIWLQTDGEQKKLRRGYLLERAQTALSVASWAVAAWSSVWMDVVCNCVIRTAKLGNQKVPSLSHHDGARPQPCVGLLAPCFPPKIRDRRHLKLAIVLAELALAASITCVVWNYKGDMRFNFRLDISPTGRVELDEAGLLARVLAETNSRPFKDAIYHCFEYDRKEQDASNLAYSPREVLHGPAIQKYEQEVIQKLHQNYLRVAGFYNSHNAATRHFQGHQLLRDY